MSVLRVRVTVRLPGGGRFVDEHLSVPSDHTPWLPAADVIICVGAARDGSEVTRALLDHPGCLVAAQRLDGGCLVGVRGGRPVVIPGRSPWRAASLAHALATARHRLGASGGPVNREAAAWPEADPGVPPAVAWSYRLLARPVR